MMERCALAVMNSLHEGVRLEKIKHPGFYGWGDHGAVIAYSGHDIRGGGGEFPGDDFKKLLLRMW
jgi:hypothetical protein